MRLFFRTLFPASIFAALSLSFTALCFGAGIEQEVFVGGYIDTLRNLDTKGGTIAYRLWLMPGKDQGFSIIYPQPITLGFEVRGGYLWEPQHTWEASVMLDLKYEFNLIKNINVYLLIGSGGNYSGVDYEAVATHYNFINRASLGVCVYGGIVQISYEHRSNGFFREPNRGVDLITASLGYRF